VPDYVIAEDLEERALDGSALIEGVVSISRDGVPSLYEQANQVWQW
jgi:hypothetical protein